MEQTIFKNVASEAEVEEVFFAQTSDLDDMKRYRVEAPAVLLFKNSDNNTLTYQGTFKEDNLRDFVFNNELSLIDDFDIGNYKLYLLRKLPIAYFFYSNVSQKPSFEKGFKELAKRYQNEISFVYVDAQKFYQYAELAGLTPNIYPAFSIMKERGKWPLSQYEPLTLQGISKHVENYSNGLIESLIRSQEIPATNNLPVTVVVGKTFKSIVLNEDKNVFILFYAPWCIYCQLVYPIWEELANTNLNPSDDVVIAKMDATENELPLTLNYEIKGFPTITLFKAGNNDIKELNAGRRSLPGNYN